ncbi:MAG: transcription termination/antitermination protein NusG [Spirochaetaceae bacterium]|jgi:transcriptional antiterminator NusG|nr:transcription termination/antitermination protein NusG [Spirochaetaceae bacterium]
MAKGWYVLQVYTGYENKVEKFIGLLMEDSAWDGQLVGVNVPAEDVIEVKDGKKRTVSKKFLPGYILLEMDLPDRGWKSVCNAVRRIQGVVGFLGTSTGSKPQPLNQEEARGILQQAGAIKAEKKYQSRQEFAVGDEIRVNEGPFESFTGLVEDVNVEKGKLRVMVGIFGRNTPVELSFSQVMKI